LETIRKTSIVACLLVFSFALSARYSITCPYPQHEISLGYGYLSSHQMGVLYTPSFAADILKDIAVSDSRTVAMRSAGPFHFTYKFFYKQWFSAGVSALYSYNHIISTSQGQAEQAFSYHTFAFTPRLDFYYIRNPKFAFYGFAAGGFNLDILNGPEGSPENKKEINAAYQVSPLCFRFGEKIGFIVELGFGSFGVVNAGLGYRHYERLWEFK